MYTKTEKFIELQQTGTDEYKLLSEIAPCSPARAFRLRVETDGYEDGSPQNAYFKTDQGPFSCDGSTISQPSTPEVSAATEVGSPAWSVIVATDGATGPYIFGVYANYGTAAGKPSGTYTVNWKLKIVLEEWD